MATSQVKKMLSGLQELLEDSPTSQIYVAIAAILFTTREYLFPFIIQLPFPPHVGIFQGR